MNILLQEKIDSFYKKMDRETADQLPESNIIDPGAKSINSLVDKAHRQIEIFGAKDYTLDNVSDMGRCAIIVDSYEQVPALLRKLKETFPNLAGAISRQPTGYRGIHLTLSINGVNTEIQISTKDAWAVKQATEYAYQKWRSFDQRAEFSQIMEKRKEIDELINGLEINENKNTPNLINEKTAECKILTNAFSKQLKEHNADSELSIELYSILSQDSGFNEVENTIESILLSFSLEDVIKTQENEDLSKIKESKLIDKDGRLDKDLVTDYAARLTTYSNEAQKELIEKTSLIMENFNIENTVEMRENEKLISKMLGGYDEYLNSKLDSPSLKKSYANYITFQRFLTATNASKFAIEQGITDSPTNEILLAFYQNEAEKAHEKGENFDSTPYSVKTLLGNIKKQEKFKENISQLTAETV